MGYTFSKSFEEKLISVGGYQYEKSWRDVQNVNSQGYSVKSFEEIYDNWLIGYFAGSSPSRYFYYNGRIYYFDAGKISTYNQ